MALDITDDDRETCDFSGFGKLQEINVSLNSNIRIRETITQQETYPDNQRRTG